MQNLEKLKFLLDSHVDLRINPQRRELIREAVERREALVARCGALVTWTPPHSTGRSPKDTYMVRDERTEETVDWSSPYAIPMDVRLFDEIWEDALRMLGRARRLYLIQRSLSANPRWALPLRVITDRALHGLFCLNMFRPIPDEIKESPLAGRPFTLLVLPYHRLDADKYRGRLRTTMAVAMDFERRLGLVVGSAYLGSVKKTMFTVMNYLLPDIGVLPLHCGAAEDTDGRPALFLGLSGTGKTTLSSDPKRPLIGDDEHGWGEDGIANFEFGCYAKLINLRKEKEPEIWEAVFHEAPYLEHGAIVENAMMYPDGTFDLDDDRLTPNSRASYPLSFLGNVKLSGVSGHPKAIIFLTADANGVLPPIAKLTPPKAMFWFLMGYTSKLAGTETGIVEPVSTFSRFFGAPFMPRKPDLYARMLGDMMQRYGARVYLINTGWTGGPYGVGRRIDITLTRRMVDAAISGQLEGVPFRENPIFRVLVPEEVPGVPKEVLDPKATWANPKEYEARARRLADDFRRHFDANFRGKVSREVEEECPG